MAKNKNLIMTEPRALFTHFFVAVTSMLCISFASCSDDENNEPQITSHNPAECITDAKKLAMLRSMKDLDGTGRLYEINYTADYKLDKVLEAGYTETNALFNYLASILYDKMPEKKAQVSFGTGCSAFAVPDSKNSTFFMGRNYDFCHASDDGDGYQSIAAILVRTAPAGGKKSISMVDALNMGYSKGFYNDGDTDLSLLMGLPYAALDGINEDGFAIGVLALREEQTCQNTGQPRIGTTTAIRMLLDRASTVKEAIEMLRNYDMDMRGNGTSNYHYFMADATGDYAIVEYTFNKGEKIPHVMEVLSDNDTLRCVTNFYVSPTMVGTNEGWGSLHGRDRYDTLRETLAANNYKLGASDAMSLLSSVSQPPSPLITSQTQWSGVYDLKAKTLRLAILREYGKMYDFKVQ